MRCAGMHQPRAIPSITASTGSGSLRRLSSDSRVRAHFTLKERRKGRTATCFELRYVVEIEGQDRPALVADWLTMWVTEPVGSRLTAASPASR